MAGAIRVGVGGWVYEPWRGTFYPPGLPKTRELEHASRRLTSIEVNGTFYRTQTPATFAKWASEVPDGFVFALKGARYVSNRRVLAEAGESIGWFVNSGITELGDRLGPINWQFAATKKFDPEDFEAFLALLPKEHAGVRLRHAVEVRHESFRTAEFVAVIRKYGVPAVYADSDDYPAIGDQAADFVYARLQRSNDQTETGYRPEELDDWAAAARAWSEGRDPEQIERVSPEPAPPGPRDVFVYFIAGEKVRDPAAAEALIGRLQTSASTS